MNIIKAASDENLFLPYLSSDGDLSSWRNWFAFLRTLHGLPVLKADRDVVQQCTGRNCDALPKAGFTEALLLCGRRSGKSKVIALCGAAEAVLSGKERNVSRGEIPLVAIISPTRFQSRIIFEYLKSIFDSTELLKREIVETKRDGFTLKNGVEISVLTGDPRTVRGFSLISCVIDEVAHFGLSEESKVRSDTELIRSLRPSLATTGGRLLAVGTPYASRGYAYTTYKTAYANHTAAVLCWNAPSTLMNLTLNPKVVDRAIAEDPTAARVEYCTQPGLFREDVDGYISRELVESLVSPGRKELPPRSGIRYGAFADVSGGRHDDAALSIGHTENGIVIIDVIERHKSPHVPANVVAKMCLTLRKYGCDRCAGDAYAAEWTRSAFADHGIDYRRASTTIWHEGTAAKNEVAKPKSVLYAELLPRLHSAGIELLDDPILISQLSSLQRRTRSGARDVIDHAPGAHDDVANVVAGVTDTVTRNIIRAGVMSSRTRHMTMHDRDMARFERNKKLFAMEQQIAANANPHTEAIREAMFRLGRAARR